MERPGLAVALKLLWTAALLHGSEFAREIEVDAMEPCSPTCDFEEYFLGIGHCVVWL